MNGNLINVFNNTIEALEEYIEKIKYPEFKKQIFDKSINSPNRSPTDLADDFLSQLHLLKAMIMIKRKKPEFSHREVQEKFFQWIDAAGIKANNYSKNLNHYLFTINEVLEGRGENFIQQTNEKNDSGPEPSPQDYHEVYRRLGKELDNPSEKKEVNIQGNTENGKKVFQQIANSLSDSDRQNFHFYPHDDERGQNKNEIGRKGVSWPTKIAVGAIILVVLGILTLLIVKIIKKKKRMAKLEKRHLELFTSYQRNNYF